MAPVSYPDRMARRWQVVKVELLRGRETDLEHPPWRTLVCPTGTTFAQLGHAIDLAFARWDHSHLSQFTVADGTVIVDAESRDDWLSDRLGATPRIALSSERVRQHAGSGDRFEHLFDFGDSWLHACEVLGVDDPEESLGIVPDVPATPNDRAIRSADSPAISRRHASARVSQAIFRPIARPVP